MKMHNHFSGRSVAMETLRTDNVSLTATLFQKVSCISAGTEQQVLEHGDRISGGGHPLLQGVVQKVRFQGTTFLHGKPEDDRHISTNRRRFGAEMQALLHDVLLV